MFSFAFAANSYIVQVTKRVTLTFIGNKIIHDTLKSSHTIHDVKRNTPKLIQTLIGSKNRIRFFMLTDWYLMVSAFEINGAKLTIL